MAQPPSPFFHGSTADEGPAESRPAGILRPAGSCDPARLACQPVLRQAIAAAAARCVAESGLDYGQAKQEAAAEVLDGAPMPRGMMPDNDEIDAALASHLDLFDPEHPHRVARMRRVALDLMERLRSFDIWLTGSVWKGVVAEHVPIHLQVFHDDPKEVLLHLLEIGIDFDAAELPALDPRQGGIVEAVQFEYRHEPVQIALHPGDGRRRVARAADQVQERGDAAAVRALMSA